MFKKKTKRNIIKTKRNNIIVTSQFTVTQILRQTAVFSFTSYILRIFAGH